jgi:hypothetical protein
MPRKHTITITGQGTVRNGEYMRSTRPFVEHQAKIDFEKVHHVEDGKIHFLVKFCETDTPVDTVFECTETKEQLEALMKTERLPDVD